MPDQLLSWQVTSLGLLTLKWTLLVLLFFGIIGFVTNGWYLLLVSGAVLYWQGIIRGFAGHINHAELGLVHALALLAFTPCNDAFALGKLTQRPSGFIEQSKEKTQQYATCLFALTFMLATLYFFVGIARICKGPEIFLSNTLRNVLVKQWVGIGLVDEQGAVWFPKVALSLPSWFWKVSFLLATLLEIAFPLVCFFKEARLLLVPAMAIFHFLVWYLMGVSFVENILLLCLFSGDFLPFVLRDH